VTDEGLRSRNGKPLGVSSLHAMLTNSFYTWKLRYGGELFFGNHQPVIDEALFASTQTVLFGRRKG
jgi:site-specific DNA recombinase